MQFLSHSVVYKYTKKYQILLEIDIFYIKSKNLKAWKNLLMVRAKGLEPPCRKALDPKSSASTNFATPASKWWTLMDSNHRPSGYEPDALTN